MIPGRIFSSSTSTTERFEDVSLVSGIAASEDGRYEAGMGIDAADVDGDGWQDVYITHLDFELNRLYHNSQDGTFTDETFRSRHRQQSDAAERRVDEIYRLRQ